MAVKIKLASRAGTGKGTCRKLRAKGVAPAVFYGPEYKESMAGAVELREISRVANAPNWETNMIDLELPDGRVEMALLRDVQRHAITRDILHVDFYQLVKDRKVKVAVPVRLVNKDTSAGVKMGGVLEHPLREIEITVLPREIPSEIVIDAAKMQLGDELFVRELDMPESAELITSADSVVVMIARPRSVSEVEETSEEAPAEVEVVGKGKRKEEGSEE
ncbi:MAG: 50S ribosomal protein L25 [Synergistaceae bacterium]|jgi:large subunit ribosomal protein L25|nr:50S ribosomal protein L25 [Synergistaceae bacterium]